MTQWAIVDTGPLVAFLDRRERYHTWVVERVKGLEAPLLTCEPVLTEAMFLLARYPAAQNGLFTLLEKGAVKIGFELGEHHASIRQLCHQYQDRPISLADACIVRMAELHSDHVVFTLDQDFYIYRKHGRQSLSLIAP